MALFPFSGVVPKGLREEIRELYRLGVSHGDICGFGYPHLHFNTVLYPLIPGDIIAVWEVVD